MMSEWERVNEHCITLVREWTSTVSLSKLSKFFKSVKSYERRRPVGLRLVVAYPPFVVWCLSLISNPRQQQGQEASSPSAASTVIITVIVFSMGVATVNILIISKQHRHCYVWSLSHGDAHARCPSVAGWEELPLVCEETPLNHYHGTQRRLCLLRRNKQSPSRWLLKWLSVVCWPVRTSYNCNL
jgi:hypothetical protein